MSKAEKIWLIVAGALVVVGIVVFGGMMTVLKWDFTKLSTIKYETNSYQINDSYRNISIVANTADIVFVPSDVQETSVVCREQKKLNHSITVKDDTLTIECVDTRKWYEYIGIGFGSTKITVYIPKGEYGTLEIRSSTGDVDIPKELKFEDIAVSVSTGDVTNYASALKDIKIKTSTGDIHIEGVRADLIDLSVSTGETEVSDVICDRLISSGSTGDMSLSEVVATESFSIERSTGEVEFYGCDATEIFIKTDTGDVEGMLLSDKVFITKTDTGKIDVPDSVIGGRCEIVTDTGDIKITVK